MINVLNLELKVAHLNAIRKEHLTRKKESRDPFSIYSTTIITGLPAKRAREYIRIRAIREICDTVRDFQLWQLNYLYIISRNFIFQHASINIKHSQFSIFYSIIAFEFIKRT